MRRTKPLRYDEVVRQAIRAEYLATWSRFAECFPEQVVNTQFASVHKFVQQASAKVASAQQQQQRQEQTVAAASHVAQTARLHQLLSAMPDIAGDAQITKAAIAAMISSSSSNNQPQGVGVTTARGAATSTRERLRRKLEAAQKSKLPQRKESTSADKKLTVGGDRKTENKRNDKTATSQAMYSTTTASGGIPDRSVRWIRPDHWLHCETGVNDDVDHGHVNEEKTKRRWHKDRLKLSERQQGQPESSPAQVLRWLFWGLKDYRFDERVPNVHIAPRCAVANTADPVRVNAKTAGADTKPNNHSERKEDRTDTLMLRMARSDVIADLVAQIGYQRERLETKIDDATLMEIASHWANMYRVTCVLDAVSTVVRMYDDTIGVSPSPPSLEDMWLRQDMPQTELQWDHLHPPHTFDQREAWRAWYACTQSPTEINLEAWFKALYRIASVTDRDLRNWFHTCIYEDDAVAFKQHCPLVAHVAAEIDTLAERDVCVVRPIWLEDCLELQTWLRVVPTFESTRRSQADARTRMLRCILYQAYSHAAVYPFLCSICGRDRRFPFQPTTAQAIHWFCRACRPCKYNRCITIHHAAFVPSAIHAVSAVTPRDVSAALSGTTTSTSVVAQQQQPIQPSVVDTAMSITTCPHLEQHLPWTDVRAPNHCWVNGSWEWIREDAHERASSASSAALSPAFTPRMYQSCPSTTDWSVQRQWYGEHPCLVGPIIVLGAHKVNPEQHSSIPEASSVSSAAASSRAMSATTAPTETTRVAAFYLMSHDVTRQHLHSFCMQCLPSLPAHAAAGPCCHSCVGCDFQDDS